MKVGIRYEAHYIYDEEASFSPHLVRLFPRADLFVRADRVSFATHDSASVQYRRDLFDNVVAFCFYPEKLGSLDYTLELDLTLEEKNPFHFLLASHALTVPFGYQADELRILEPYLRREAGLVLPPEVTPGVPVPTVEGLVTLNQWVFENFQYERRDEGEAMRPAETLARGAGACRDFAELFVEILRAHGVAARLASGFLWEPPDMDVANRRAESALHEWVEAYLPGPGWVGIDPTNGVFCNEHFMTTAVGLTADDIAPVKGHYYGKKSIGSRLESKLEIRPL